MQTITQNLFKIGQRVFWTDPEGITSGYGTIQTINGTDNRYYDELHDLESDAVIALKMDDGGETEALPRELSSAAPEPVGEQQRRTDAQWLAGREGRRARAGVSDYPDVEPVGERAQRWEVFKRSPSMVTIEVSSLGLRSVIARLRDDELCPEHGGSIEQHAATIVTAVNNHQALVDAARKFVDAYQGEKALRLGNGQARRSLDEFRAALAAVEESKP